MQIKNYFPYNFPELPKRSVDQSSFVLNPLIGDWQRPTNDQDTWGILADIDRLADIQRLQILIGGPGVGKGTVIPNTAPRYTAFAVPVTVAVLKIFAVRYYGTNFWNLR